MRSIVQLLVASLTCALAAVPSSAQPEKPVFWSWSPEPATNWSDPDHRFTTIIRVFTNGQGATQAGIDVANAVAVEVAAGRAAPGRIAVLLQNFGNSAGLVDLGDLELFAQAYEAGETIADHDGDGTVTPDDASGFLADYAEAE
ncbi:MAG: hypothetical protein PSX37_06780 [bacterium]|nr:hypothetical protein [bacterium]